MKTLRTLVFPTPEIDLKEVLWYMRAGQDESAREVALRACALVRQAADCKACFLRLPVSAEEGGGLVRVGEWEISSRSLAKHLSPCREAVVFAATAGSGADRAIAMASAMSGTLALAADAAGSVLVEAVCDALERELQERFVFRYSPGYGDFSIEAQTTMVRLLQTERTIGVTLTEGLMLRPSKSVTAIIGIL